MALSLSEVKRELAFHELDVYAAVLFTLAYSDVFDFPLTLGEIHRYLIACKADQTEVAAALSAASLRRQISSDGEYYAVAGRQALFALRHRRAQNAEKLWPLAWRFGRLIGAFPFVRMVAVTGALASQNVEPGADLDYLIVTKPGWLWLCRAMVLALSRLTRLLWKVELCPNYLITERGLKLDDEDLFTAQELARMLPVYGFELYRNMRASNAWVEGFLPNGAGARRDLFEKPRVGPLKRVAEVILGALQLGWLEQWEMRRKIAKFSRLHINNETRFSADFCKGHFDGHKEQTERAFLGRLAVLKVGEL